MSGPGKTRHGYVVFLEVNGTTKSQGTLGLVLLDGRTGGSQSESIYRLLGNGKGNT